VRVNKGTEVSALHGTPPSSFTPTTVLVGKGSTAAAFFTGYLGAWAACESDSNHTNRAQIDNLFAAEFGTSFGTVTGVAVPTVVAPATATQFDAPFDILVTVPGGVVAGDVVNADKYVLATSLDSATVLRATLTPAVLFTAGIRGITVGNANGIGPPLAFTVAPFNPGIGPNLTSLGVTSCTAFDDPFALPCGGLNFTASSVVFADGIALPTTFNSVTSLTAQVTDAVVGVAGVKAITVHDPAGTSGAQPLTVAPWTYNTVPEITGWWELDDVNVTGSAVTQINDKTGNARHAVQATGAKQGTRTLADANFNGQASLDFNGTSTDYVVAGVNITVLLTQTAWLFIAVYRCRTISTSSGTATPFANQNIASLNGSSYFGIATRTGPLMYGYSNDGSPKVAQNGALLNLTTQYVTYRRAGGLNLLAINAGAEQSIAAGNPTFNTQNLSFGSGLGANYFNGQAALWASFNATPSAANVTRIKNYARIKYGWIP
jgi:hypothetical protein